MGPLLVQVNGCAPEEEPGFSAWFFSGDDAAVPSDVKSPTVQATSRFPHTGRYRRQGLGLEVMRALMQSDVRFKISDLQNKLLVIKKAMFVRFARVTEVHVYWKGAAELIFESCTGWLDTDGSKHSMTLRK